MSELPTGSSEDETGSPEPGIDTQVVRELADILKATDLTTIEVERGSLRIRVAREVTVAAAPVTHMVAAPTPVPAPAPAAPSTDAAPAPIAPAAPRGEEVTSPMVGTVYLQAQPGQPPFVKPGDKVSEGQTLLIIEAMKTMNPIPSPRGGTVVEVLVGDSQPVEYGEPLVILE